MNNQNSGTLYVVATPIGNLGDMSQRAVDVLKQVDVIAAEDTRHSGRLLQHFVINTPTIAVHEHNEVKIAAELIARLEQGESIALISDAGTPLVSDPGYHLIRMAGDAGIQVTPIPGACAAITALSASGLPSDRFSFEGFLPAKSTARKTALEKLIHETGTLIFYETPHRIVESLADMTAIFGEEREAVMARELTKKFETIKRAPLSELLSFVKDDNDQQKGEFVILIHGAVKQPDTGEDIQELQRILKILLEKVSLKEAVAIAVEITGLKKNQVYEQAVSLKEKD